MAVASTSGLPTAEIAEFTIKEKEPSIFGRLKEEIWSLVFKELGGHDWPAFEPARQFMQINRAFRDIALPHAFKRGALYIVPKNERNPRQSTKMGLLGSGKIARTEYLRSIENLDLFVLADIDKSVGQDLADSLREMTRLVEVSWLDNRPQTAGDLKFPTVLLKHIIKSDQITSFEISRDKPPFRTAFDSADKLLGAFVDGRKFLTSFKISWISVKSAVLMPLLKMLAPNLEVLTIESLQTGSFQNNLLLSDPNMPPMPKLHTLSLFALCDPIDYNFIKQVVVKDTLRFFSLESGQHKVDLAVLKHVVNLSINSMRSFAFYCQNVDYAGWSQLFTALCQFKRLDNLWLVERDGRYQRTMPVLDMDAFIAMVTAIGDKLSKLQISIWRCETIELLRLAKAVPNVTFFEVNIDPTWIKLEHTFAALRPLSKVKEIKLCIHMPRIYSSSDNTVDTWENAVKNNPLAILRLAEHCENLEKIVITGLPGKGLGLNFSTFVASCRRKCPVTAVTATQQFELLKFFAMAAKFESLRARLNVRTRAFMLLQL